MPDQSPVEIPTLRNVIGVEKPVLDLAAIKTQAVEAYRDYLSFPLPTEVADNVKYLLRANEIVVSTSPHSNFFKRIIDNLPTSLEVHIPWRLMTRLGKSDEMIEEDIASVSTQLNNNGIQASASLLKTPLSDNSLPDNVRKYYADPENSMNFVEFLYSMQNEYYRVLHAMRITQETKAILHAIAPYIPWPTKKVMPFATENTRWEPNGFWYPITGNDHAIGILEPSIDSASIQLESRDPRIQFTGERADIYNTAVHEIVGHAGFAEMYEPQTILEVFGDDPKRLRSVIPNIAYSLTEGYAIFIEELAARVPALLGKRKYFEDVGIREMRDEREKYLEQILKEDPTKLGSKYFQKRRYTHGVSLMRQLLHQLGMSDSPSEAQLRSLRKILQDVDLSRAANIWYGRPDYLECLIDPLHNLPKVVKTDSSLP